MNEELKAIIITVIITLLTLFGAGVVAVVMLLGLMELFEGSVFLGLFLLGTGIGLFDFLSDLSDIELL